VKVAIALKCRKAYGLEESSQPYTTLKSTHVLLPNRMASTKRRRRMSLPEEVCWWWWWCGGPAALILALSLILSKRKATRKTKSLSVTNHSNSYHMHTGRHRILEYHHHNFTYPSSLQTFYYNTCMEEKLYKVQRCTSI
jgi:hypothetical protein